MAVMPETKKGEKIMRARVHSIINMIDVCLENERTYKVVNWSLNIAILIASVVGLGIASQFCLDFLM